VIQVDSAHQLKAVRFGNSEQTRVGDWVLAIGAPFGFAQTVTAGIISSTNRDSRDLYQRVGFQFFLQTDAAINRGNSGGPLINLAGEVIGINTAIATSTGDYNGICFALPASEALHVYRQLASEGRVTRGLLGALTERVTPQIARVYGLPLARGAIVSNVSAEMEVAGERVESPAARAGLRAQDIITNFNGESIIDDGDLVRKVAATRVGTKVPLRIIRNGQELTLIVTVGKRPDAGPVPLAIQDRIDGTSPLAGNADHPRLPLGIRIESITTQVARQKGLGTARGCLILRVEPGSVAEDAELRPGDIIEEINRQPIRDNEGLKRGLAQLRQGDPIVFQVYRQNLDPVPRIFISLTKP
ncbi:MAG: PDZ domain-containing protein, partial [Acidobacteriota bacterium]